MVQPRRVAGMRRYGKYVVAAACVAVGLASTGAAAARCQDIRETAPDVVTLMASKSNPATDGWIVSPDCTVETITVMTDPGAEGVFSATSKGIERVLSVPTESLFILIKGNPLSRGADFSKAERVTKMSLSNVPENPEDFLLPPSLESIILGSLVEGKIASLDGVQFPSTLAYIYINSNALQSLKNVAFPANLENLYVSNAPLTTIDIQFPPNLHLLSLSKLPRDNFERVALPDKLETFSFVGTETTKIRGVKWPASLKTLDIRETEVTTFEIRRSDVATIESLDAFFATVTQTSCSGSGKLEWVGPARLCVIPDAEFDILYGFPPTPTPAPSAGPVGNSSTTSAPGRGSSGGSLEGSSRPGRDDSSSGSADDESVGGSFVGKSGGTSASGKPGNRSPDRSDSEPIPGLDSEDMADLTLLRGSSKAASNATASGGAGRTQKPSLDASSPSSSPLAPSGVDQAGSNQQAAGSLFVMILCSLASIVIGAALYRAFVKIKNKRKEDGGTVVDDSTIDKYNSVDTPTMSSGALASKEDAETSAASAGLELLAVAFRQDKDLIRGRIDDISVGAQIARGGYGVVYRGSYQGRVVAIKQMHPEAWQSNVTIANFLDEIRLCTRLDHPKIVEFVGVWWSGGQDLAAVSEFMAGGDLHSVLHANQASTGLEWTSSWTPNNLQSKALIALDVTEAVVYLHSFNAPIIHRDLKAKNVLLDLAGNAKLSDFGISREVATEETMTSNVGTAAWIAPEVLRGEQYSAKADIYSLGALLVEMDRCSHPYANEPLLLSEGSDPTRSVKQSNTSDVSHKNTQIAVLVSTGRLRPSTTAQCPEDVAALVRRCVSYEPRERPTAMEVFYQLRLIRKSGQPKA